MARTAELDDVTKFLVKVSKGTKGIVDVDVAMAALAQMPGWSMTPIVVALEVWKLGNIAESLGPMIGLEPPTPGRYGGSSYEGDDRYFSLSRNWDSARQKELKTMHVFAHRMARAQQIYEGLLQHAHVVDALPEHFQEGQIYIRGLSPPQPSRTRPHGAEVRIDQMWLTVPGWRVTAADGASSEMASGSLAGFWTFLYKHGAKADAKAALEAQGSEILEQAQMTKEQRERVVRARLFLPEILALFNGLTQARFEEVVDYLTKQYIADAKFYIANRHLPYDQRPQATRVILDMTERKEKYGSDDLRLKDIHEAIASKHAHEDAEEARRAFVWKNTDRISTLARRKGETPTATVLDENESGVAGYGGNVRFDFTDDGSFVLRNKTVWKYAPVTGRLFAQFPTTFHDVKLPGGKKMSSPSERRMLDVFAPLSAKSMESNPDDASTPTYYASMAERLARGLS